MAVLIYCLLTSLALSAPALQPTRRVTVSGQSAGASMAMQHLVAFSASVDGAGIAAGSPYGCGWLKDESTACYYGLGLDVSKTIAFVRQRFRDGLIDDPANLRETPVVLFNGKLDTVVRPAVMRATHRQLEAFTNSDKLVLVTNTFAAHVWSLDHGQCSCGDCMFFGSSTLCCDVNNCGYDLSGDMLQRFYGPLKPRTAVRQRLHWVDQWKYVPLHTHNTRPHASLMQWAIIYVPTACEATANGIPNGCQVHVNYHGCTPKSWSERREWALNLDLNEYAEANNIIVVYPQAGGNPAIGTGCWNWLKYHGDPLFDTRHGAQLLTVLSLVEDLPGALLNATVVPNGDPVPPAKRDALLIV
mmetsp:Transcript_129729/g.258818  ORF Transcript_129729/g.258818 Transcript_129729/m.258818 type:complete len:358 (-) Transcript_129729:163-1236(-)